MSNGASEGEMRHNPRHLGRLWSRKYEMVTIGSGIHAFVAPSSDPKPEVEE
jgi:hypothetical protein